MRYELVDKRTDKKWAAWYAKSIDVIMLYAADDATAQKLRERITIVLSDPDGVLEQRQGMAMLYIGISVPMTTVYLFCKRLQEATKDDAAHFDLLCDCLTKAFKDLSNHFYARQSDE